ncbi:hypothetical protein M758_6G148400 [Ceratodon purpureus]|nr:hypothetical protein M758_6G148400 [Ceratodon purpureus]
MGTAVCGGPSLWVFSSKRGQDVHVRGQCRSNGMATLCCHHSSSEVNSLLQFRAAPVGSLAYGLGSQVALTKQGLAAASWSARSRQGWKKKGFTLIVYSVERLGLDGKVSEEDASAEGSIDTRSSLDSSSAIGEESGAASEGGALELVDTDGIIFEETDEVDGNDINGMLRQPRSYLVEDLDNWEMFAAEEGARPAGDDETDNEIDDGPTPVRRRKAEDVLPVPDSASMNWTAADKEKVKALQAFRHMYESKGSLFVVEAMRPKHMNDTEELLVDSFAELMGGLLTYRPLLAFTVKQYVRERYATLPHSVTLVGLYAPVEGIPAAEDSSEMQQGYSVVAGTVELSFSVAGHPDVPTPAPPPNSPYICNMAIKKEYRRRGLGRQMLKAAEELALSMGCEDMYLHVRIMDTAPLTMYREAGYQVVSTDSLLSVLTFQRRRHLMRKRLSRSKLVPE